MGTQFVTFRKRLWGARARITRCRVTRLSRDVESAVPALPAALVEEFDRKIKFVAASLEKRPQAEFSGPRCDILLGTYVLGLTTPFYEDGPPDQHLEAIRDCLIRVMPPERVTQALLATPAEGDDWYASALEPIEAIGRKDGHALFIRYVGADGIAAIQNSHSYRSAPEIDGGFKEPAVTSLRGTAK
jgi:hypothetical protein